MTFELDLLPRSYAVCRFDPGDAPEDLGSHTGLLCLVRSPSEVSAVVVEDAVQDDWVLSRDAPVSSGWRCLRVRGPLDLSLTGVLAALIVPLAASGVSVFPFASYDTDWLLVPGADLDGACAALRGAGHSVSREAT